MRFEIFEDNEVAAMIVEPIQAEGGDYYGSPQFFQVKKQFFNLPFHIAFLGTARHHEEARHRFHC